MDYQQAWSYLDDLQFFKIKLGLDSMADFLARVGNPQQRLRFVHVAGTNGKGSVSVTLLTLLAEAGYKVGLYTSPHLSSVRERFRINDRYISRQNFAALASRIRRTLGDRQITYFEFTTALALLWFAEEEVDLAVLEVGLGGRLDATNVVTPLVGVITNVSMDHEAHLGATLTAVAGEKAGIIKPGVPLVSGVADDDSRVVVEKRCAEMKAPLFLLDRDFSFVPLPDNAWEYRGMKGRIFTGLFSPMRGVHQLANFSLALAVLDCLDRRFPVEEGTIRTALTKVRWPGRLEYFRLDRSGKDSRAAGGGGLASCTGVSEQNDVMAGAVPGEPLRPLRYLLDGAHNPAGIATLTASLARDFTFDNLICVWASMADKDIGKTLGQIAPLCRTLIFTRPEEERSATTGTLRDIAAGTACTGAIVCLDRVEDALAEAERLAGPDDLILVAGSLYLIGRARRLLLGELIADENHPN